MTIKEIAAMANVSIATVSKILHKKDQNISKETRERVLKIIRECNYFPYANVRAANSGQTRLIGIFVRSDNPHPSVVTGIMSCARRHGYSVIVCPSSGPEEELINISALRAHQVDGIVWMRSSFSPEQSKKELDSLSVPYVVVDYEDKNHIALNFNFSELAYRAAQMLIDAKHQRLYCIADEENPAGAALLHGFKKCLFDNKIPFDAEQYSVLKDVEFQAGLKMQGGIVCFNADVAAYIYRHAADLNLQIPRDLSVVCLKDPDEKIHLFPRIASVLLPCEELGSRVWEELLSQIEKREPIGREQPFEYKTEPGESIDIPKSLRSKRIVVVGAINQDTLLYVDRSPQSGETITISKRVILPGGKGLNQALGTTRLGAQTYLIGKIGKDYEGSMLYDFLKANNVNTEGVIMETNLSTGHAYIEVADNGDSSIVVYNGANECLSPHDIRAHEPLFEDASFCLLQTELQMETVEYAAALAREHNVKTILKPCVVSRLSDELLRNIDILLPNIKEANRLLPDIPALEDKAQWFMDHGTTTVIITLGSKGCYLRDANHSAYFKAANFAAVDTTGAADAFASALAVYLSRSYKLETAIRYATCAAGLSVTRQGVPPSLVDQSTLDLYIDDRNFIEL